MASGGEAGVRKIVLLTENYPPYNMALDGKNFAQGDNLDGIAVQVMRETFKRAGVEYNLTLRFPWERVYKLALEKPGYAVFSTVRTPNAKTSSNGLAPSPRCNGYCWPVATALSSRSPASNRQKATGSALIKAMRWPSTCCSKALIRS